MSTVFPIPRQLRRQDFLALAGQSVFGPVAFAVYDVADLRVRVRTAAGHFSTLIGWSAVLTGPAPATPIVTLPAGRALGDVVRIDGARLASRTTDVTLAGTIRGASLETELDRIALTLQELRRDDDDVADALSLIDAAVDAVTVARADALAARDQAVAAAALAVNRQAIGLRFVTNANAVVSPADATLVMRGPLTAPRTVQLCAASAYPPGQVLRIVDASGQAGAYPISVPAAAGDTIEGAASIDIGAAYNKLRLVPVDTNLWTIE